MEVAPSSRLSLRRVGSTSATRTREQPATRSACCRRLDGYIQGKQVISKRFSGRGVDAKLMLLPDDTELIADGADSTRVVLRVTDEFGAVQPFANDAIKFEVEGPAEIIGDNPFSLIGGTGAVWIRAQEKSGKVILKAVHPQLGAQQSEIQIVGSTEETV